MPGCKGTWTWTKEEQVRVLSDGQMDPPQRMCSECYAKYRTLQPVEVKCASPDCDNTWTWAPMSQLEAWTRAGKPDEMPAPPRRLCDACMPKSKGVQPMEVTCKIPGCENTWTWSSREQIMAGRPEHDVAPPQRMCSECYAKYRSLKPMEIKCRVPGCDDTWTWSPMAQLEAWVGAGKPDEMPQPPGRMCNDCYSHYRKFKPVEVECKISGCDDTWTWSPMAQLEAWVGAGRPDEMPQPPGRMCDDCYARYKQMEPAEIECKYTKWGCTGYYVITREELIAHEKTGRPLPKPHTRACSRCRNFLKSHTTLPVTCSECGNVFMHLDPERQLQYHLRGQEIPSVCPTCISKKQQ